MALQSYVLYRNTEPRNNLSVAKLDSNLLNVMSDLSMQTVIRLWVHIFLTLLPCQVKLSFLVMQGNADILFQKFISHNTTL